MPSLVLMYPNLVCVFFCSSGKVDKHIRVGGGQMVRHGSAGDPWCSLAQCVESLRGPKLSIRRGCQVKYLHLIQLVCCLGFDEMGQLKQVSLETLGTTSCHSHAAISAGSMRICPSVRHDTSPMPDLS